MTTPYVGLPDIPHSVFYAYTISVGTMEIGSFEKFSQKSTRTVERIREIYYNTGAKVIDMVWGGTDITLELSRVELYETALIELFGATGGLEYINTKVDVHEAQINPSTGTIKLITFKDCVPSDFGKDISTDTARVVESMTLQASYVIYDATGNITPVDPGPPPAIPLGP
jgi:hypothetical protein